MFQTTNQNSTLRCKGGLEATNLVTRTNKKITTWSNNSGDVIPKPARSIILLYIKGKRLHQDRCLEFVLVFFWHVHHFVVKLRQHLRKWTQILGVFFHDSFGVRACLAQQKHVVEEGKQRPTRLVYHHHLQSAQEVGWWKLNWFTTSGGQKLVGLNGWSWAKRLNLPIQTLHWEDWTHWLPSRKGKPVESLDPIEKSQKYSSHL